MAIIEQLTDAQNFGQWIVKINEVIDAYNNTSTTTSDLDEIIQNAIINGQIGDVLSKEVKTSYNDYIINGVYYVSNTVNNRPQNTSSILYVATNGTSVTQYAITIETEPKLYIRCRVDANSDFTAWSYIPSKFVNDNTYLKIDGGTITGEVEFQENSTFKTITVKEQANFNGIINIENDGSQLFVTNDKTNVSFNSQNELSIAYYIQDDNRVTTDLAGENVAYYLFENKLITYNTVYYIQRNLDTITSDENGNNVVYYIQEDGRITLQKTGEDVKYYLEDDCIVSINPDTEEKTYLYYIVGNKVYTYGIQLYIKDDIIYSDSEYSTIKYYIEDNKILAYKTIAYLQRDPQYPLADPIKVTSDSEGNNVLYYIHDNKYTTDEEGLNVIYYVHGDTVTTDEDGYNVIYYIHNDTLIEKEVLYYIKDNVITSDEENKIIVYYIFNDNIINLVDLKFYIQDTLDTVTSDRNGKNVIYYIQKSNELTSDKEGNNVIYYMQPTTVTEDNAGQIVVYYVIEDTLKTYNIVYYIQEDNTITTDEEGLLIRYKRYDNQIIQDTSPLVINLNSNVCDINGTAEYAQYLKKTGLTDSFKGESLEKAASGKAVFDLYNFTQNRYMTYDGGIFKGIIVHQDDVRLDKNKENRPVKIYSYDDLYFEGLKTFSFVANNDWCELYIDKFNESTNKDMPCIFGARTRTGTTANEIGTPVYALGSIEFTEDTTTIRVRKTNLTQVNEESEKPTISLTLSRTEEDTSFYPSEDRVVSLGSGSLRFNQIYSASGEISTSDRELKTDIVNIDDETLLDKWKNVQWKFFKYKDSVEQKGNKARIHSGLVAQDVEETLSGLDITQYGFYCLDSWNDIYDEEYMTIPAKYDASGNMIAPQQNKVVKTLKKKAGEQRSLRYQEIQAIENAYLRREIENLKKEIESLKTMITK